jgi:hypothetical protein
LGDHPGRVLLLMLIYLLLQKTMLITLNLLDLWGEKIPDLFKGKDLNLMDKTIEDLCKKLSDEELKKRIT